MKHAKYILAALAMLIATFLFYGCDRMNGKQNDNQAPIVEFVNTPMDTSTFNYAPIVYWSGKDADGYVSGYEYYDDSTEAAREAYRQDRTVPGTLLSYINAIPAENWVRTTRTQETIYLGTAAGEVKEHVFVVRAIDDKDLRSLPKVHTFFRTNIPPNPPTIKWAQDEDENAEFVPSIAIAETLFWGDTTSSVYPGVEFLWQGSDSDSRDLNIIPLEFSYALVKLPADTMPYPILDDSLNIVGYGHGWSAWSQEASHVFYGFETGDYELTVRVRDDGLTLCRPDSFAYARFSAVKPTFEYQLLIVDENPVPTPNELSRFGARPDTAIMNVYYGMLPQAFEIAETFRQIAYDSLIPEPFEYTYGPVGSGAQVQEWDNKNLELAQNIPYSVIGQFKWVWVIHDNNPTVTSHTGVMNREHVMDRYMRVGGSVMLSGRRLFDSYHLPSRTPLSTPGDQAPGPFFADFFNMYTVQVKPRWTASVVPDFEDAVTANSSYPDLAVDDSIAMTCTWGTRHYPYLPEIDYFSRAESQTSFDYSATLYTYVSSTRNASYDTTNVDCDVLASSPSVAALSPAEGHDIIFAVSRIYNRTRGVAGQFLWIDHNGPSNHPARIICSTPEQDGAWLTSDSLEVDYTFSPISDSQNKPVACIFQKHEVRQMRDPRNPSAFIFQLTALYRSALFTFPLSFIDQTPAEVLPGFPAMNPAAYLVAMQMLTFNSPMNLGEYNFDFSHANPHIGPAR
jgi:hypothetical protein